MFLSGIKYQVEGSSVPVAYKFARSESKFHNVVCHHGTPNDLFQEALIFGVTGQFMSRVKLVVLYISDGDGNQWIIDRSHQGVRYSFNQRLIDDGEEKFRASMLEGEDDLTAALLDVIMVKQQGDQLIGERLKKASQFAQYFNHLAEHKLRQILERCQEFLQSSHPIALQQLVSFCHKARIITQDYRYIKRMIASTKKEFETLAKFDPDYLVNLKKEVEILRKIERDAVFFSDPSHNHEALSAKLKKTEKDLSQLCNRYEIHQLPMLDADVSWDLVVKSLSRLQAYEKLELAFRRGNNELESLVKPIFQDHIRNTKSFLLDDKKLLGNIEQALKSITKITQDMNAQAQAKPRKNIWKLFGEFDEKSRVPIPDTDFLEKSRQAVNRVLRSINEMCSNIEVTSQSYTDNFDEIQSRYEKIVAELGKAKKQWLAVASKYQLDPQASLKSILNLINNLGQISLLYVTRKECRDQLSAYTLKLKNLERLLEEWKIVTKSQKSINLRQHALLITEVRNILSYKEKKETQLAKLSRIQNKIEFYHYLQGTFESKINECTKLWNQHFNLLGIETIDIDEKKWSQLFEAINKCEALSHMIHEVDKPIYDEAMFSQKNISCPLTILVCDDMDDSGKMNFLRLMEYCSSKENILLITEDSQLARLIEHKQISLSQRIKLRKPEPNQENLNNKKSSEPVMSEKARAALELFKVRNSNISS